MRRVMQQIKKHGAGAIVLFFIFAIGGAAISNSEVVTLESYMSVDGVHSGDCFYIALKTAISAEWHIHAHEVEDEFLVPTNIVFEEMEKIEVVEVVYPEAKLRKYDYTETPISVFEGEEFFFIKIKAAEDIAEGKYTVKGAFKYQACDNRSCLPPGSIPFEMEFNVVPAAQETEAINREIFEKLEIDNES